MSPTRRRPAAEAGRQSNGLHGDGAETKSNPPTSPLVETVAAPASLPSTCAHLDALVCTGAEGWLVITAMRPGVPSRSASFRADQVDDAAAWAAQLDAAEWNVYLRSSLIGAPLTKGRGNADATSSVPALAVDVDVAGPGQAPKPGLPLPPTLAAGLTIFRTLPPPTLEVNTGGGAHLWWVLDEPVVEDAIGLTVDRWAQGVTDLAAEHGWHLDKPDRSRILRLCGTHRRKPGVPTNRVVLAAVAGWPANGMATRPWSPTGRYSLVDLLERLPDAKPSFEPKPRPRRDHIGGGVGPADAVASLVGRRGWRAIMAAGWEPVGTRAIDGTPWELWRRPGATSDYSIKCIPGGPAVVWSDALGLPTGEGVSPWRLYVQLHHDGDEAGAARTIRLRSRERARR